MAQEGSGCSTPKPQPGFTLGVKKSVQPAKKEKMRAQLNPLENVMVGGFGGILETSLQMPLVTWKYVVQEGRPLPNTLPGWYRGVTVQAGSLAPVTAFQVMTNGILERLVTGGKRDIGGVEGMATSFVAGGMSAIIYGPADLMVIQQQKLGMSAPHTYTYLRQTYGNLFWTKGLMSTAGREASYVCGYLGIAPFLFEYTRRHMDNELLALISAGIVAGTVGSLASHPLDTGKTVIQADISGATYPNCRAALRAYYREGGVRALYRGGVARSLRAMGACTIVCGVREAAIRYKTSAQE